MGDINEGHLKNNYLFQGDFNEFDEDLGWNQFALRDYDSQIGRFVQQDPYQQYATPYTGMGNDPVNLIDPSGGVSIPSGLGQALNFAKEGGTMAEVIITFTRVTSSVSSPLSTISIVSTTLSLLNSTLQGSTLISGKMAAGAVGGNAGLDDFILVNTKSKTVQVTKTDDPYDVVQIDGQKRYQDYRKGITEEKYRKLGYQVRPGPEGVGMGAVDGAILTFVGAKFTNWLFKGAGRLWGRLAGRSTPALRAAYEAEVRGLASIAKKMKVAGKSSEDIARYLHQLRRELGIKYKSLTPKDLLQKIYQRNLEKYGDKLGPTIDYLRQQGKSWDDIIESATRPGGKDIKF